MPRILIPLPSIDFDPTEAAVPWQELKRRGHQVVFATPDGREARADQRMLDGRGLGIWRALLRADARARDAYRALQEDAAFTRPRAYAELRVDDFDGVLLPGGHAAGMREYLEASVLHALIAAAFERRVKIAAICHGVVLVARARRADGLSVLHGRRTTALTRRLELSAWAMTRLWLGDYYRTYPTAVEDEVIAALADRGDFVAGPMPLLRDSPAHPGRGFALRDGNYLSARWPGDAHRFAAEFAGMLEEPRAPV